MDNLFLRDAYGQCLSGCLFADAAVLSEYIAACAVAERQGLVLRFRLLFDSSASELQSLFWETLRDPQDKHWLLADERILFSRFLRGADWRRVQLRAKGMLRALVVISNPTDLNNPHRPYRVGDQQLAPVDVTAELARIRQSPRHCAKITYPHGCAS